MAVLQETSYEQLYRWAQSECRARRSNPQRLHVSPSAFLVHSKKTHLTSIFIFWSFTCCFSNLFGRKKSLLLWGERNCVSSPRLKTQMTHILWLSEPKEWQRNQNFHRITMCWNRSGNKRFRLQKPLLCNYAITKENVVHVEGLQDREQHPFESSIFHIFKKLNVFALTDCKKKCRKQHEQVFFFFFVLHRWMQRPDSGDLRYQSSAHPSYGGLTGSACSLQVMKTQTQRHIIAGVKTTSSPKSRPCCSHFDCSGAWFIF